jgi:chromosomal replication initiation ATPase DnaA
MTMTAINYMAVPGLKGRALKTTVQQIFCERKEESILVLLREVCLHFNVQPEHLYEVGIKGKLLKGEGNCISTARYFICHLLKKVYCTTMPLTIISQYAYGKIDHAAVIHALNSIQNYLDVEPETAEILNLLRSRIELKLLIL